MIVKDFAQLNEYLKQFVPGSILDGDFYTPDKMYDLLRVVGNPHQKLKMIHVAGTSGKTSTCYYIAEILRVSGAKVGLTVSPHIFEVNERVQIDGQPLNESKMCQLFTEFVDIKELVNLKPTYFEILVTFAFWVFGKYGCTHAVVEVGLGGLKDATNVIEDPEKVAVISDISLDHMRILGDTIKKITKQKAGIIKQTNQVFCYEQDKIVNKVIDDKVHKTNATLHRLKQSELAKNVIFDKRLPEYQKRNWLLAKEVAKFVTSRDGLTLSEDLLTTQQLVIPARMQRIKVNNKDIILDGAHNPQKLQALVKSLKELYPNKSFAVLMAFVESKKPTLVESLKIIHEISDNAVVTEFTHTEDLPHKVIPAHELASDCKEVGFNKVQIKTNASEAFHCALQQTEDIILVTGSFYLIGSLSQTIETNL